MSSRRCDVCGTSNGRIINSRKYNRTLCHRHYMQLFDGGKILEPSPKDPNEILFREGFAELLVYNTNYGVLSVPISLCDVEKVKPRKWIARKDSDGFHIVSNEGDRVIQLARYILDCPDDMLVIYREKTLDNRRENIFIGTRMQSCWTTGMLSNNTSGIKGVYFNKRKNQWCARIGVNNKSIFLGYFDTREQAGLARKVAEEKYYGEFASTKGIDNAIMNKSDFKWTESNVSVRNTVGNYITLRPKDKQITLNKTAINDFNNGDKVNIGHSLDKNLIAIEKSDTGIFKIRIQHRPTLATTVGYIACSAFMRDIELEEKAKYHFKEQDGNIYVYEKE